MAKAKEFPVDFKQNVNGCWTGHAFLRSNTNKLFMISFSAAPGTAANRAKPQIRDGLKVAVADFLAANKNYSRISEEEYRAIEKANR